MTGLLFSPSSDLRVEAEKWLEDNPDVYRLFEKLALERVAIGKPFGIGQLTEVVRWEIARTWSKSDGFKINNNHRAYIARQLVRDHPQIGGFLRFRKTRY